MTPAEHRAEAERLLDLAHTQDVITVHGPLTRERAESIRDEFEATAGRRPVVVPSSVHVNNTPLLLAALTHAVLGQQP